MAYHDLKFQTVEDQVRFCNLATGVLGHIRHLPKVLLPVSCGAWSTRLQKIVNFACVHNNR